MSHLGETTGQVFVPRHRRVPVRADCAAISRADEVFSGIHSLVCSWDQPAGAEGDRKRFGRNKLEGGRVRSLGKFQKDGAAGGATLDSGTAGLAPGLICTWSKGARPGVLGVFFDGINRKTHVEYASL